MKRLALALFVTAPVAIAAQQAAKPVAAIKPAASHPPAATTMLAAEQNNYLAAVCPLKLASIR